MTKIISINPEKIDNEALMPAVFALKNGGLCAFPTETVYGLGANAFDAGAISKIYKAKNRPADNPLIVHIAEFEQMGELVCEVPEAAHRLARRFWGGPLTLILKRSEKLPPEVSAGLDTVAVRLPSHPAATALIRLCGFPIAAPSANLSGRPSPTAAEHVIKDLDGRADVIIDGGNAFYGIESTVLDLTVSPPAILRPGAVTHEELSELLGEVVYGSGEGAPKSPGMKYRHYAPNAPVFIVQSDNAADMINSLADEKTGILSFDAEAAAFKKGIVLEAGKTPQEYAAHMFFCLRRFDELGVNKIFAIAPGGGGISEAVRNRLYKAAGGNVI